MSAASPLRWVSIDARTGRPIAYLPNLVPDGALVEAIGRADSVTAGLNVLSAPANWWEAVQPRRTCVLALDAGTSEPVWGGWNQNLNRGPSATVELSLVTLPGYLERLFIRGASYRSTGQNDIVTDLVTQWVRDSPQLPGMPIEVRNLDGNAGAPRDRDYPDSKDVSVFAALSKLMGVRGGPEWVVRWERRHDPERFVPVLEVGARVGEAVKAGFGPAVTFSTSTQYAGGGVLDDYQLGEDWTAGKGATDALAYASGTGDERLQSQHATIPDTGGPRVEYRWSPSSSITDGATLDSYARAALGIIGDGTRTLSLTIRRDVAPAYGSRWRLGDDVGFRIEGPAYPDKPRGIARPIGVELAPDTITPTLAVTTIGDVTGENDDEGLDEQ